MRNLIGSAGGRLATADSGFSHRQPGTWAVPLRGIGAQLVVDLQPGDRGPQALTRARSSASWSCATSASWPPTGYVLRAGPGAVDWDFFRRLHAAAAAAADPARAGQLLRRALELWRGPPLADVADAVPALAPAVAQMEEARMAVLEQRIEADLRAGLERDLLGELAALTATYPLSEQLRAFQMVALYRCGRQGDALRSYHQLRRSLADELGVDPGPNLRALFEAMLRADPLLGSGERPLPGPDDDVSLARLAFDDEARAFQGRHAELGLIRGMLAAPGGLPRVVRVHGPAGIGKTAFAYALARVCHAGGWPAVVIDSRDFRHDAASLGQIIAAACSKASGKPLLLVLDTFGRHRLDGLGIETKRAHCGHARSSSLIGPPRLVMLPVWRCACHP